MLRSFGLIICDYRGFRCIVFRFLFSRVVAAGSKNEKQKSVVIFLIIGYKDKKLLSIITCNTANLVVEYDCDRVACKFGIKFCIFR